MIVINDIEALRQKCEPATKEEAFEIIPLLEQELKKAGGIGLAANQIGIQKTVAIIRVSDKCSVNLVNASIANGYDEFLFKEEGCLSFPDKRITSKRFNEVHVVGNLFYPHSFTATGLFAVCCQHEIDHLAGVIMTDREVKKVIRQPPNEKCACGSNLKFKKCCARKVII